MSSRYVYAVAAILILSACYGVWCQAPLIWDGAYQFDMTLAMQHPYVYQTRFHTWFLWYPTVWASRMTDNVNVLQAIYGLPFLLAPAAGLLLSWWIVRRHAPHLILWVIFGVAAATVPGQIFVINDSFFQLHLFWPLFVAMFVPLDWPKRIVLTMLAVFQFVHPLGVPLMLGAAGAAILVAIFNPSQRRRAILCAGLMVSLALLAATKIAITNHLSEWADTYAQEEATWDNAMARWRVAVSGMPLAGLKWMWAAAGVMFVGALPWRKNRGVTILLAIAGLACVAAAGRYWLYWAHGPVCLWGGAIDYRRWVGPLAAPYFVLGTIEAIILARRRAQPEMLSTDSRATAKDVPHSGTYVAGNANLLIGPRAKMPIRRLAFPGGRGPVAVAVALLFALTLGMQYTTWHQRTNLLMAAVRSYPTVIVPKTDPDLYFVDHSPLAHWGSGNYVAAMLGKKPSKMFLDEATEKSVRLKYFDANVPDDVRARAGWGYFASQPDAPPGPGGWFDFRPALEQARAERDVPSRRVPGRELNGIP